VDAELRRCVEALRRPLELAAADGFAGIQRVGGLGHALRVACDALIARWPAAEGLAPWRQRLARWEHLDDTQRAVEVARGLRLIARHPRGVAPRARGPAVTATLPPVPAAAAAPPGPPSPLPAAAAARGRDPSSPAAAAPPGRPSPSPAAAAAAAARGRDPSSPPAAAAAPPVDRAAAYRGARGARPRPAGGEGEPVLAGARGRGRPAPVPDTEPTPAGARAAQGDLDPLAAPTRSLPGIGPAFAARLAERELVTVEDLLWCLPRRYDDVREARPLAEAIALPEGQRATLAAEVAASRMVFARGRRWAEVRLVAPPAGEAASATVRWFNVLAGIEQRMPPGARVVLSGVLRRRGGRAELANPDILGIELPAGAGGAAAARPPPAILARYPDVPGVPAARLRAACASACARVGAAADDGVPAAVERAAGLPPLADALAHLHAPPPDLPPAAVAELNAGQSVWQRRLAFGELFALGVAVAIRRRDRRADAAVPCPPAADLGAALARALPFRPTAAQARAIAELGADLARPVPMNRLLQGDVGSGKTAVAFAAALHVARAGRQTAVMAPTELLAEQHAETWGRWAAATGLRVELLTASTPRPVRSSALALLAAGQVDVVVGTHALLAEGVGLGALGLVVIDEQHRFGVAQRARLRDKGDGQGAPHLLVMTATPIPRTLALTAFGDLDVSVLDELPPGRQPVATRVLTGARGRAAAYRLVAERARAGERAYVVCPKIEAAAEAGDGEAARARLWRDAVGVAEELAAAEPRLRVGLVHGRLDAGARDAVMRAFKAGELDALVATTVIEVGVDVPAATVMVVHDAERFGLAQLHQLRGRVGRGGGAAHCLLLAQGALGPDAEARLGAMVATHDGFRIAEEDLALRGPGELLGPRQAGAPRLRFGDLAAHTALLLEARTHAEAVLASDPGLVRPEHAALRRALDRRLAGEVFGPETG
jgi:ATP-dependent DNA helicase RecG